MHSGRRKEATSATHHLRLGGLSHSSNVHPLVHCVTLSNHVLWVVPSQHHMGAVDGSDSDIVWRSGG